MLRREDAWGAGKAPVLPAHGDGHGTWAGRQQQSVPGRQLLPTAMALDQATKDKFMGQERLCGLSTLGHYGAG